MLGLGMLFVLVAGQDDAKADDEAAKLQIAQFKAKPKKTEDQIIEALQELASSKHSRIEKEIAQYLRNSSLKVKAAAASHLASYENDKGASEDLLVVLPAEASRAIRDKGNNESGHEGAVMILEALGTIKYRTSAYKIHGFFRMPNLKVPAAAIRACGSIGNVDSGDQLIVLLQEIEMAVAKVEKEKAQQAALPPIGAPGLGTLPAKFGAFAQGFGGIPPANPAQDMARQETMRRKTELVPAIQSALQAIAGEGGDKTAGEWMAFWSKNKSALKAKQQEADKAAKAK